MQGIKGSPYICQRCGLKTLVSKYTVDGRHRCTNCARHNTALWRKRHPRHAYQLKKAWELRRMKREPDYWAKRVKAYRLKYPEKEQARKAKRIAWLKSGTVTIQELRDIYIRDKGCCTRCGKMLQRVRLDPIHLQGFDHLKPRPFGGKHEASNLVLCCFKCNVKKGRRFNGQMPNLQYKQV